MSGPTPPSNNPAHNPNNIHRHAPKKPPNYKDGSENASSDSLDTGRTHQFGPLQFSEKQWEKFLRQLEQMISLEIKRQQKRIKKAQEELKRSIRGEPL